MGSKNSKPHGHERERKPETMTNEELQAAIRAGKWYRTNKYHDELSKREGTYYNKIEGVREPTEEEQQEQMAKDLVKRGNALAKKESRHFDEASRLMAEREEYEAEYEALRARQAKQAKP